MTSYLVIHLHHRLCHTIFGNIGLIGEQKIQASCIGIGKLARVVKLILSFVIDSIEIVAQDSLLTMDSSSHENQIQDRLEQQQSDFQPDEPKD